MPTYQYRCFTCNHSFDQFQKFIEDTLTECPECSGPIRRVPQAVGILFKGSGWYVNDMRELKNKSDKAADTAAKPDIAATATEGSAKDTGKTDPGKDTAKPGAGKDSAKSEPKKTPAAAAAER